MMIIDKIANRSDYYCNCPSSVGKQLYFIYRCKTRFGDQRLFRALGKHAATLTFEYGSMDGGLLARCGGQALDLNC